MLLHPNSINAIVLILQEVPKKCYGFNCLTGILSKSFKCVVSHSTDQDSKHCILEQEMPTSDGDLKRI